jgi:hypothetical protein
MCQDTPAVPTAEAPPPPPEALGAPTFELPAPPSLPCDGLTTGVFPVPPAPAGCKLPPPPEPPSPPTVKLGVPPPLPPPADGIVLKLELNPTTASVEGLFTPAGPPAPTVTV